MTASTLERVTAASSRRALLAGALGGIGAWAASAIGRARPVRADGEIIHVGDEILTATSLTEIRNTANDAGVFTARSTGGGWGVLGDSDTYIGVYGASNSDRGVFGYSDGGNGVEGYSGASHAIYGVNETGAKAAVAGKAAMDSTGVQGFSGGGALPAPRPKTGVYGYAAQDDTAIGTVGESVDGIGLLGLATGTGISAFGLFARSNSSDAPAIGARSAGDSTAVLAKSGTGTFPSPKPKTAVYGYADQDSASRGLWGESPAGRAIMGTSGSGYAGYFAGKVYTSKFHEMTEITAPAAPGSNKGRLFLRDNGGKTQLCIRFSAGAIQVIATQP